MKGIYLIKCKNKVYVGQSINVRKRITRHKYQLKNNSHPNNYLQKAFNKSKEIFEFLIIECILIDDLEYRNNREIYWIDFYESLNDKKGYNLTKGGKDAAPIYPKCALNLSNFRKSYWKGSHTPETKTLISFLKKGKSVGKGKIITEKTKEKMSCVKKEYFKNNPPNCSNKNIFTYQHKDGTKLIGPRYKMKQFLKNQGFKVSSAHLARLENDSSKHCRNWKIINCILN